MKLNYEKWKKNRHLIAEFSKNLLSKQSDFSQIRKFHKFNLRELVFNIAFKLDKPLGANVFEATSQGNKIREDWLHICESIFGFRFIDFGQLVSSDTDVFQFTGLYRQAILLIVLSKNSVTFGESPHCPKLCKPEQKIFSTQQHKKTQKENWFWNGSSKKGLAQLAQSKHIALKRFLSLERAL